ncbi:FliM/FliN family flagellar motor switch protein [Polymorphobacter sp.]|uniref:FliM/FliN family flagellar motor switch protein n=1 Tax=Polymorphobacter sp. TaxID=1909290 RepID=UPI003F6EEA6A
MSELRIRSEAFVDHPVIDSFIPPASAAPASTADLGPLVGSVSAALAGLLGTKVQLVPATETEAEAIDGQGGLKFASLLLTIRLGGTPPRADTPVAGGDVLAAYRERLLAAVAAAVADSELWPRGLVSLAVTALAHGVEDGLWLRPPTVRHVPQRLAPSPHPRMLRGLGDVPMRLAVELAAAEMSLLALLPLRPGQIITIAPASDMALRMDGQAIGRVSLSSRPDGRQEALLVALDLSQKESR